MKSYSDSKVISKGQLRESHQANSNKLIPVHKTITTEIRSLDCSYFYGAGMDEIATRSQLEFTNLVEVSRETNGSKISMSTIRSYFDSMKKFAAYTNAIYQHSGKQVCLSEVNREFMMSYIRYLTTLPDLSYGGRYSYYVSTRGFLIRLGLSKSTFPINPFPKQNRKIKGVKAYSDNEMKRLMRVIRLETRRVLAANGPISVNDLAYCFFMISARTGLNPTSILELTTDCIRPSLKPGLKILVSFKRRAKKTTSTWLPDSKDLEVCAIKTDVESIIGAIAIRNANLRAKSKSPNALFVGFKRGQLQTIVRMSQGTLCDQGMRISKLHGLVCDDGFSLSINASRFRKTFINRVYELSGQDAAIAAQAGGHSIDTSRIHYMEPSAEAERNFAVMGELRIKEMRDLTPNSIASCSDPLHGQKAPKNGRHCSQVLACFRCRNFVVTEDDLYRLFSFYWVLVRARNQISKKDWNNRYRHIVRVIDEDIAGNEKLNKSIVKEAKEKSKTNPHPAWRTFDYAAFI